MTISARGINRPSGVAAGPDGNLWFTNSQNDSIGRITPAGVVSNFTGPDIRTPQGSPLARTGTLTGPGIGQPVGIAAGPDGNMWFTDANNYTVGSVGTEDEPTGGCTIVGTEGNDRSTAPPEQT